MLEKNGMVSQDCCLHNMRIHGFSKTAEDNQNLLRHPPVFWKYNLCAELLSRAMLNVTFQHYGQRLEKIGIFLFELSGVYRYR